jgi:hypothetical protein
MPHERLKRALSTAATFAALAVLWSIWNSQSLDHVVAIWRCADLDTLLIAVVVLTVIGILRIALDEWEARRAKAVKRSPRAGPSAQDFKRSLVTLIVPCVVLGTLSNRRLEPLLPHDVNFVLRSLASNAPNESDEDQMRAGYYENLIDVRRFNSLLSEAYMSRPASWKLLEDTPAIRWVDDIRLKELVESTQLEVNGHRIEINSYGMRDEEYTIVKEPGSYRIAMLGSSIAMGWGVDQGQTFEAVLEQRLAASSGPWKRVEILNFAINGYSPLSQSVLVRERVLRFAPDAIYLVGHFEDPFFVVSQVPSALLKGIPLDPFLADVARRASVDASTPRIWAQHRLESHWPEMIGWAFERIGELGRAAGVELIWLYLPGVYEDPERTNQRREELTRLAAAAGFRVIDLSGVYGSVDRDTIAVAPWDGHPNARGHEIVAQRLYDELRAARAGVFENTGGASNSEDRRSIRVED